MTHNHHADGWLDWRIGGQRPEISFERSRGWIVMAVLPFLLLGFLGAEALFVFVWVRMFQEGVSWKLAFPPMLAVPFGFFIVVLGKGIPSAMITKVHIRPDQKATEAVYLGIFKRLIPGLPDRIRVRSRTGTMFASLTWPGRSFTIPLGSFDTDHDEGREKELALRKTSELRELLKVEAQIDD